MRPLLVLAALTVAGAAAAQETPAPSTPAPAAAPAKEKKICRRETGTGSIMPRQVCHTASEWKAQEGQANLAARQQLGMTTQGMAGAGRN